jgi:cytosine/adenosine deaminase-related metal-dependent hydrolase
MNKKGILVGLGTDAMTVNMLEELRAAHWIHKLTYKDPSVGFMECANALALNNAKIANKFFKGVGELKENNQADVILIDYFSPTPLNEQTFLGHLIFGIPAAPVDTTICNGKVLMQHKKLTTLDEEEIMARAQELSQKLWDRF